MFNIQCSDQGYGPLVHHFTITISCQAGESRRKWQPSPFVLSYFLLVVWKLLWVLLKTPPPSRRKKSGIKPKVRKKVEKGKIAEYEICIELFGLRTITIKIKSAIIVFFSFFLLSFSSLLLFILFFSFVIVFFRSYWTKKNPPLALFHSNDCKNDTFRNLARFLYKLKLYTVLFKVRE